MQTAFRCLYACGALLRARSLSLLCIAAFMPLAHAGDVAGTVAGGDETVEEGPLSPGTEFATTEIVPGSLVASADGKELTFAARDSDGRLFQAYVNAGTGEVLASSGEIVIYNRLSPAQWQIAGEKYAAAKDGRLIVIIPIVIGSGMCYLNDQITKQRFINSCKQRGGTPNTDTTGMCGFWASYRCENLPPPMPRTPSPGPSATPGGFWRNTSSGLIGVTATNNLSVNAYDSDWFNP